jgi:LemA protein
MITYIVVGAAVTVAALVVFYIIHAYNSLVRSRNRVTTQWAQIDVQLSRRADLIPNLVETVKAYAAHEKELFEKVAAARNALDSADSPGQAMAANDRLSAPLSRLVAVAEAYPDLKADSGFTELRSALRETEDKIAYARQFYNDTILIYKNKRQQFPVSIFARAFKFKDESYYIANEDKKGDIKVSFSKASDG